MSAARPEDKSHRHRRGGQGSHPLSSSISLLSFAGLVLLLTTVVLWHDRQPRPHRRHRAATARISAFGGHSSPPGIDSITAPSHQRYLFQDSYGGNNNGGGSKALPDDDTSRSAICRRYLRNFLNGTTDANDQCQAFYNAYKAADCEHDTNVILPTIGGGSGYGLGDYINGGGVEPLSFSFLMDVMGDDEHKKKNDTQEDDVVIDDFFENWECCDSIRTYYEKNCESDEGIHSVQLLGVMLVLLVCIMIKAAMKAWNVHWIPDACAFILVGTIVGVGLRLLDNSLVKKLTFDNDLFLQIMLPPIIFQAALSIDKRAFRRDLFPILAFAGIGTAFSALAIGWIVHQVSNWGSSGSNFPLLDSLVFGSLISSIDPVATLGILSGVGVSQTDTLYTLIFGESLLNDGVAIVLFDTLRDHLGEDDGLSPEAYREMAQHFCIVLFGSMAIGVAVGMSCTLYFSALRGRQAAVTEVGSFFIFALIPYYIADGLKCSGIIAIMVMGFMMDYFVVGGFQSEESAWSDYMAMRGSETGRDGIHRTVPHGNRWSQLQDGVSKAFSGSGHILSRSRQSVGFFAQVISSIMDTAIFAYLGLFLFNDNVWNLRLNLTAILSCVSSRLVMVVVLGLLINIAVFFDIEKSIGRCFRCFQRINLAEDDESTGSHTRMYLDRKTQLLLFLSGIRGAVSFALVENIPVWDTVTKTGSKFKAELKTMTSSSIVFTLFVFGALTFVAVKHGSDAEGPVAGSNLTHRLLSEPLDSDDEATNADLAPTPESMEIDHIGFAPGVRAQMVQGHGRTLAQSNANDSDERYRGSNEWIS